MRGKIKFLVVDEHYSAQLTGYVTKRQEVRCPINVCLEKDQSLDNICWTTKQGYARLTLAVWKKKCNALSTRSSAYHRYTILIEYAAQSFSSRKRGWLRNKIQAGKYMFCFNNATVEKTISNSQISKHYEYQFFVTQLISTHPTFLLVSYNLLQSLQPAKQASLFLRTAFKPLYFFYHLPMNSYPTHQIPTTNS